MNGSDSKTIQSLPRIWPSRNSRLPKANHRNSTLSTIRPTTLLASVAKGLKPTGVVGIVDFKKDGGGPGPEMDERVDPEKVIADATAAGLELRKRENFLRYQYLLIFGLPASSK